MRRRTANLGAVALAVALAVGGAAAGFGAPAASEGEGAPAAAVPGTVERAWAAPNDGEEPVATGVPTDDTGMVDETQKDEASSGGGGGGQTVAETPLDPNASNGADADAEAPEGEEPGTDVKPPKKPQTMVPDAVFPDAKDADNLVNPQQKPDSSFIYDTSINDLQSADSYLNDQTVQVIGEVVGDRLWAEFDPGYCWVVLQSNDGNYAEVPVFLTVELSNLIDTYGSYGRKGTTLQVRGTFHLACPQHEGLTDLHADNVSVVAKGTVSDRPFNPSAFIPGAVLVGVGLVLALVFHRMREGQR